MTKRLNLFQRPPFPEQTQGDILFPDNGGNNINSSGKKQGKVKDMVRPRVSPQFFNSGQGILLGNKVTVSVEINLTLTTLWLFNQN
ncbi:MAG: hypothetical protein D3916_11705 [Candidatus Electrothrix sp. MAN1_4]|nr:hypothetical protein [Candidatus Electrothrix sp. MAN1_4]